jgi:hypothetical protein
MHSMPSFYFILLLDFVYPTKPALLAAILELKLSILVWFEVRAFPLPRKFREAFFYRV